MAAAADDLSDHRGQFKMKVRHAARVWRTQPVCPLQPLASHNALRATVLTSVASARPRFVKSIKSVIGDFPSSAFMKQRTSPTSLQINDNLLQRFKPQWFNKWKQIVSSTIIFITENSPFKCLCLFPACVLFEIFFLTLMFFFSIKRTFMQKSTFFWCL